MSIRSVPGAAFAICCLLQAAACTRQSAPAAASDSPAAGCLPAGDGRLEATVRGALVADIDWDDAQMQCEGGPRPDGQGLRIVITGPLPSAAVTPAQGDAASSAATMPRRLRFIFGIDLTDLDSGPAQVLATNLTMIVEDEGLLFSTRGNDRCAVENFARLPLPDGAQRVSGRGYCLGPASDLAGEARVLVPTFTFRALVRGLDAPASTVTSPAVEL